MNQKLDLTTRQLNRLKKNKVIIIKPSQLNDKGVTFEIPKNRYRKMMRNFGKGMGYKIGGEAKEDGNEKWKLFVDVVTNVVSGDKVKKPEIRKELSYDLSEIILKALEKSECANHLISIIIASDIVSRMGDHFGFGIISKGKAYMIRPLVRKIIKPLLKHLVGNDRRVDLDKCEKELTPVVADVFIEKWDELNSDSNRLTQLKHVWSYATKKKGEKLPKLRKDLTLQIADVIMKLLKSGGCFKVILSNAIATDLIDRIGDYTGGFGIKETILKKMLKRIIIPELKAYFKSLVETSDLPVKEDTINTCSQELGNAIIDGIVDGVGDNMEIGEDIQEKYNELMDSLKRKPGLLPPSSRSLLEKIGNENISSLKVFRHSIDAEDWIDYATMLTYKDAVKEKGYDHMYHLGFYINDKYTYQKQEVVNIKEESLPSNKLSFEVVEIPLNGDITIASFIDNQLQYMGDKDFSTYDAPINNCQKFVKDGLKANKLSFENTDWFQDVKGLFDLMPDYVSGVTNVITDIGAVVNKVVEGEGTCCSKRKKHKCQKCQPIKV